MPHLALLTCDRFSQGHPSDAPLFDALAQQGISAQAVVWTDPAVNWEAFDAIVIRTPWDYYTRPQEFAAWLAHIEALGIPLWNPADLVRWNLDKNYLRQLAAQGVPTVPTFWFNKGDDAASLPTILAQNGWNEVVLKPAVSAGAWRTYRFSASTAQEHIPALAEILESCDALLQPFIPAVVEEGEWSMFFFGSADAYSHSVLKTPKAGDFRVQPQYDSTVAGLEPPAELIATGRQIVAAIPFQWLYARVDGVRTPSGFQLMELEVIEPHLFLEFSAGAAQRYVQALTARL